MSFDRTLGSLAGRPWAFAEESAPALHDLLRAEARGEDVRRRMAALSPDGVRATSADQGAVVIIPVAGVITQRIDWLGTSTTWISGRLRLALADRGCSAIVLLVASPGGSVSGVPELADEIFKARSRKPIIAFVDPYAASAAYWIASQASEIVITPSGQAGSVGVFILHTSLQGALVQAGIEPTFIKAGRYKTEGNPFQPLSDAARAHWQRSVDETYADFVAAVARGRGVPNAKVRDTYGEGRMLDAREAVRVGMADRIGVMADAVGRAVARAGQAPGARASNALGTALAGDAASRARHARLAELREEPSALVRARRRRLDLLRHG